MVEIRKAPVPVRVRWTRIAGIQTNGDWFCARIFPIHAQLSQVKSFDALTVELSNGQTIIVRAKK